MGIVSFNPSAAFWVAQKGLNRYIERVVYLPPPEPRHGLVERLLKELGVENETKVLYFDDRQDNIDDVCENVQGVEGYRIDDPRKLHSIVKALASIPNFTTRERQRQDPQVHPFRQKLFEVGGEEEDSGVEEIEQRNGKEA